MKRILQVASPPAKPLLIFDGDCNFCRLWVRRWQRATGESVDYLPFQDPAVASRFPELPRGDFEAAVHLIQPDGRICNGAEAAFRTLAHNPHEHWLLDWYEHSPVFARAAEWCYSFIARHRGLFSFLTRMAWGTHVGPASYVAARRFFLRCLAVIYFIAFVSLWIQLRGLIGSNGILPAKLTMESARQQVANAKIGLARYQLLPTLCWFNSSDRFLKFQCAAGAGLAILLCCGIAPAPCLFLLWLIYLSLTTVGREFLSFQWDNLLLETGFLAIFFAPWQLLMGKRRAEPAPSRLVLWLLRWLLFRLMFQSGCIKLLSGDATWSNLSALSFHYETQPLPTWLGWYAHQLPSWFQEISAGVMFFIELVVPFLIFTPRRLRQFACATFIGFQVLIMLTGNYCFFNLLTIALCLLLLDDEALSWRKAALTAASPAPPPDAPISQRKSLHWQQAAAVPVACLVLLTSLLQFSAMFRVPLPWPTPLLRLYSWLAPFRTFNSYGLFAVMTTSRVEIVIQGSSDGVTWRDYQFKYKPGDLKRRPGFVEPYQPRLDWQMWFAALGTYRQNPWLMNLCVRLLQGSPEVLALLDRNPFPYVPPRQLRAIAYYYHFTDPATRRKTGAWWRREEIGQYMPAIGKR